MRKFCWAFYCCYNRYAVFPKSRLFISQQPSLSIINGLNILTSNKPIKLTPRAESSLTTADDENLLSECVFPDRYLTDYEKKMSFNFTKDSIIRLIEDEIADDANYSEFYNKNDMILSMKKSGSIFSKDFPCIKMIYKIRKDEFNKGINIKIIDYYMNDIETRKKWDASLKDFKKIEGDKSVYILHSVSHKPSFFIAEREVVDKRYDFYVNDIYYDFSSSVDDTFVKCEKDIVRTYDYFSGYKMYEEGDFFYFNSITQVDFKMNVPQAMYNATMPMKLKEWYTKLKIEVNKHETMSEVNETIDDIDDEDAIININKHANKETITK